MTTAALELKKMLEEKGVVLVAVSKTKPASMIQDFYDIGFRIFGENRVQELVDKHELLPKDIQWHMIGNLQKNKVKYIAPFVSLIHSVSSSSLLEKINNEAKKNHRRIPILLQLKIAEEYTKSGLEEQELTALAQEIQDNKYPHIIFKGLMGMATFTDDRDQLKLEFSKLTVCCQSLGKEAFDLGPSEHPTLSFGMSGDYELAVEEGSNMVRIGSKLFGARW